MRWMSYSMTQQQMRDRIKRQTRRLGWKTAKVGDRVLAVSKSQGRKKGELPEEFGVIVFVEVRREPLNFITANEVLLEGFEGMRPSQFVTMFCKHMGCRADDFVTVIRFKFEDELTGDEREVLEIQRGGASEAG